uniref:Uncharacterized protein n=1 Tax=Anopheles darlingi TaxID=43151 RepID=A0A2M4D2P4_ANODA
MSGLFVQMMLLLLLVVMVVVLLLPTSTAITSTGFVVRFAGGRIQQLNVNGILLVRLLLLLPPVLIFVLRTVALP